MKFEKFESVLLLDEILVFKGATDWLQAVSYKTASDRLDNYLESSRADYNANYDAALDYYEYESDSLSDSIADRIFNIYLYIEFGQKAVI